MRLFEKELLLYNRYFDKWEVIDTGGSTFNTHLSNNSELLFTVANADGEFFQSQDGIYYTLKHAKISGTDEPFEKHVDKVIQANGINSRLRNCHLVLTSDKELYFSDDNLETLSLEKTYSKALDIAYGGGMYIVVGADGFYATGTISSQGDGYKLTWTKPTSFTSRTIHKIKYFEDKNKFVALDFAYANNATFVNGVYTKSTLGSSSWTKEFQETTYGTGWKLMVDVAYCGSKIIAIRSDSVLNLHNVTDNTAYVYSNIPFHGSGITYCGYYIIACATDGQLAVTSRTTTLDNWKLFTIYDPEGSYELSFDYIASSNESKDIVVMDTSYLVHVNTKKLAKLMEL